MVEKKDDQILVVFYEDVGYVPRYESEIAQVEKSTEEFLQPFKKIGKGLQKKFSRLLTNGNLKKSTILISCLIWNFLIAPNMTQAAQTAIATVDSQKTNQKMKLLSNLLIKTITLALTRKPVVLIFPLVYGINRLIRLIDYEPILTTVNHWLKDDHEIPVLPPVYPDDVEDIPWEELPDDFPLLPPHVRLWILLNLLLLLSLLVKKFLRKRKNRRFLSI